MTKIIPATVPNNKLYQINQRLNNQLKVSEVVSKAREQAAQNDKYKITPIQEYKTTDEELNDQTRQIQIALANIKEILPKPQDAQVALTALINSNDIVDFNRFFGKFQTEIKGLKSITPNFFIELWQKFKNKITETDNTGIILPSQSRTDLSEVNNKLEGLINAIDANLPNISEHDVETIKNSIDAISQTNEITTKRLSQMFDLLTETATTGDMKKFMEIFADLFKKQDKIEKVKEQLENINSEKEAAKAKAKAKAKEEEAKAIEQEKLDKE